MARYDDLRARLQQSPETWLITGVAGFIGSHLLHTLLDLDQNVVGLDDFSTGRKENLAAVQHQVGDAKWAKFKMIEGSLCDADTCAQACLGVDRVLHQGALGSVPRSIEQPQRTHNVNVNGFVNIGLAAVTAKVKGFSYASSSSVYGDHPALPKQEGVEGRVLSPYAASKRINETYAEAFSMAYGLPAVGLRYFNVIGPRQDPNGMYAAVVPKWLAAFAEGTQPFINGDGTTSRDFCPVQNVVQANLLAATVDPEFAGRAYNIGLGGNISLLELYRILRDGMAQRGAPCAGIEPEFRAFRKGDVLHSQASIAKASDELGYHATISVDVCLAETMDATIRELG